MLVNLRASTGYKSIYRGESPQEILDVLHNKGILYILLDQDTIRVPGVFVDFMGSPSYTASGPAALAMKEDIMVIPGFIIREGYRHRVIIEKPVSVRKSGNKEKLILENTRNFSKIIESYIRNYPEQWVWMHERWKTSSGVREKG